jgi:hypothetical protein
MQITYQTGVKHNFGNKPCFEPTRHQQRCSLFCILVALHWCHKLALLVSLWSWYLCEVCRPHGSIRTPKYRTFPQLDWVNRSQRIKTSLHKVRLRHNFALWSSTVFITRFSLAHLTCHCPSATPRKGVRGAKGVHRRKEDIYAWGCTASFVFHNKERLAVLMKLKGKSKGQSRLSTVHHEV